MKFVAKWNGKWNAYGAGAIGSNSRGQICSTGTRIEEQWHSTRSRDWDYRTEAKWNWK